MEPKKMTWKEFENLCEEIIPRLGDRKFTRVYGVPGGGLVPAIQVAKLLGIARVTTNIEGINDDTLIVSDINNTGERLEKVMLKLNQKCKAVIVAIYHNQKSWTEPDIWIREKKADKVIFPWELE